MGHRTEQSLANLVKGVQEDSIASLANAATWEISNTNSGSSIVEVFQEEVPASTNNVMKTFRMIY